MAPGSIFGLLLIFAIVIANAVALTESQERRFYTFNAKNANGVDFSLDRFKGKVCVTMTLLILSGKV